MLFVLPFTATPILAAVLLRRQWSAIVAGFAGNLGLFALALGVFTDAQLGMWPYAVYGGKFWLTFLAITIVPTVFMLGLAIWRLRPANESDRNAIEFRRTRPRPPVEDEAIYWKQRHVEGAMPLLFRIVPFEFRVFAFGVVYFGLALASTPSSYLAPILGIGGLVILPIVTLVLAGTAVSGERDAGTWDALRLVVSASDYVTQTIRGVKASVWPYWLALLPAIVIVCIRDIVVGIAFAVSWMFAGMEIHYCAIGGVYASVRAKSSWTSVLQGLTGLMVRTVAAILLGFAGSVIAFVLFSIVCCSLIGSLNRSGDMVIIAGATIGLIIFSLLYHSFCLSTTNLHFVKSVETLVSDDGLER